MLYKDEELLEGIAGYLKNESADHGHSPTFMATALQFQISETPAFNCFNTFKAQGRISAKAPD